MSGFVSALSFWCDADGCDDARLTRMQALFVPSGTMGVPPASSCRPYQKHPGSILQAVLKSYQFFYVVIVVCKLLTTLH